MVFSLWWLIEVINISSAYVISNYYDWCSTDWLTNQSRQDQTDAIMYLNIYFGQIFYSQMEWDRTKRIIGPYVSGLYVSFQYVGIYY